jgi:diguanylate cyclase
VTPQLPRPRHGHRLPVLVAGLTTAAVAAAAGWAGWLVGQPVPQLWQLLLLAVLLPTTELSLLHVRFGHHQLTLTWGELCVLLGLVLTSPGWVVVLSLPLVTLVHVCSGRGAVKSLVNGAVFTLASSLAGLLLVALADAPYRMSSLDAAVALLVACAAWTAFSYVVTGAVIAVAQGQPLRSILAGSSQVVALVWTGNVALGCAVLLLAERSPAVLGLLPPVLAIVYLAYRGYLAARQESDVWRQLEAATRELNGLDQRAVAAAALRRAGQLFRADGVELLVRAPDRAPRTYAFDPDGALQVHDGERGSAPAATTSFVELDDAGEVTPVVTWLTSPLEGPQGRVGELRLLFGGPVRLSARERQVLRTFGHAVATTLLNAALHEDVRAEAARTAHEASHDALTGLGNRVLLSARQRAALEAGEGTTALLLLDLDHFREINDTLGHEAGDALLQEVGRRLDALLGEEHLVARLGGDEFAVLVTGLAGPRDAEPVATAVLDLLDEPVDVDGLRLTVEGSVGIACAPQDAGSPEELLRRADVALYQAKSARGQWMRYDAERDDSSVHRQALVAELRAALESDQLVVHFQPQVDLSSGLLVGTEALCRWEHPVRGLLPPAEFVPVLEQSGLVRPFTLRVLDAAVAQCVRWQGEGRPVSVAVNLSARSLLDRALPDDVATVLTRHGLPPQLLVLEITETTATSELEVVEEVLGRLRGLGVEISVDDFGTGYSSLAFLKRTAVHELKVDRTFVTGMLASEHDLALVRATVQLARSLGARSVAEGVEDAAQAAALRDMGCDVAQGYWLSKPLPAAGMRGLLGLRVTTEPAGGRIPGPRTGELRVLRPAAGGG